MYFPQEIWKHEIMSYFPKPIKKIPYINDLKFLFKEADIILFSYTNQWMIEYRELSDVESDDEPYFPTQTVLLRCNFYEKWIRRCIGRIDINYWRLDLLHDDPDF